jgi:catechol 2,3-dioxygenase-like lactoylglutathione lyase family enzyme
VDTLDHIAVVVPNIAQAIDWYTKTFECEVSYQDDTWAFIEFENVKLALVVKGQHPPHMAVMRKDAETFGQLTEHRDGTKSCYIEDPAGNSVEVEKV